MAKFMIKMELEIEAKSEDAAKMLTAAHLVNSMGLKPIYFAKEGPIDVFGMMQNQLAGSNPVKNNEGYVNIVPIEAHPAPEMLQ